MKRIAILLLLILIPSCAAGKGGEAAPQVRRHTGIERSIVYKTSGGRSLALDVYHPFDESAVSAPVVFVFHGGGWSAGERREMIDGFPGLWQMLRESGRAVVFVQYSLTNESVFFPEPVIDCLDAIKFILDKRAHYGVDPADVTVLGYSAGAHLAMMCAYADGEFGYDLGISRCVSLAGPTDLNSPEYNPGITMLIRDFAKGGADDRKRASPIAYIGAGSHAPLLLIHSDEDAVVPYSEALNMKSAFEKSGSDVTLITLKNYTHVFGRTDYAKPQTPPIPELYSIIFDFIAGNGSEDK